MADGLDTSLGSISVSISKGSVYESGGLSMYDAALSDALGREEKSLSNESIQKGDTLLDTYTVEAEAISGGMGSVWRVHHQSWNTDLAMKRPQPRFFAEGSQRRKENFIKECEAWINLGLHPNIVSCYYVREIGGVPTIFSEWMNSGSLKDRIKDGTLYEGTESEQSERLIDLAIQFARGLRYSHENGLIHRDVKPDNLLLTKELEAKVADFGLAKARDEAFSEDGATHKGGYTPEYCSSEQAAGLPADARTDTYSWALTVLEMYTKGRVWESGPEVSEHREQFLDAAKLPLSEKLRALLYRCLEADTSKRPGDFAEIEEKLYEIYRSEVEAAYTRPAPKAAADTADSLNNRALSFIDMGKPNEAARLFRKILSQIDGTHPEASFNGQLLDFCIGSVSAEELTRNLELANRLSPSWKATYYCGLAKMLTGAGGAVSMLESAYATSGKNTDVAAALERAKSGAFASCDIPANKRAMPWQLVKISSALEHELRARRVAKVADMVEQYLAFMGPTPATQYLNAVAPNIPGFDNSAEYERINDNIAQYGIPQRPHSHMLVGLAEAQNGIAATACCMDLMNRCLLCGTKSGGVAVFSPGAEAAPMELPAQKGSISALAVSGTGQIAAVAFGTERDGYRISFWNLRQQRSLGQTEPYKRRINSIQFSLKDSMYIVAGEDGGNLYIRQAGESADLKRVKNAALPRFNENGDILVFDGKRPVLMSVPKCKTLLRYDRVSKSPPTAMDISMDGRMAAMAIDGEIVLFNKQGHACGSIAASDAVTTLCFCSDGRHLYSGDSSGKIKMWNAESLELEREFCEHSGAITSICGSTDMHFMASCASDGRMILRKLIWNYEKREPSR